MIDEKKKAAIQIHIKKAMLDIGFPDVDDCHPHQENLKILVARLIEDDLKVDGKEPEENRTQKYIDVFHRTSDLWKIA